jgi:hypothetical protein
MQRLSTVHFMPDLIERRSAVSNHILSKHQVGVLTQRAEGDSSGIISHRDCLCHDESLVRCLRRTEMSFYWSRACVARPCHISRILINGNFRSLHSNARDISIVLQKEELLVSLSISAVSTFKLRLRFCKS